MCNNNLVSDISVPHFGHFTFGWFNLLCFIFSLTSSRLDGFLSPNNTVQHTPFVHIFHLG
jgi:hypothetical protein